MHISRRELLGTAMASAIAGAVSANAQGVEQPAMAPLDYGHSFVCNTAEFNAVRFWVESRTRIIDDATQTATDYYQCGACKSEHTFAEQNLFQEENYDFLPILGGGYWLVFRRTAGLSDTYRTTYRDEDLWGAPTLKLRTPPKASLLNNWEEIRDATAAALPIVTQTEIADPDSGLRAIIECPSKTMNVSIEKGLYQVDTGPVAYPDLSKRHDPGVACFSLAFLAFNAPDFADFIVEQPTPVVTGDASAPSTYHYTKPFSRVAKNRVYALGEF